MRTASRSTRDEEIHMAIERGSRRWGFFFCYPLLFFFSFFYFYFFVFCWFIFFVCWFFFSFFFYFFHICDALFFACGLGQFVFFFLGRVVSSLGCLFVWFFLVLFCFNTSLFFVFFVFFPFSGGGQAPHRALAQTTGGTDVDVFGVHADRTVAPCSKCSM